MMLWLAAAMLAAGAACFVLIRHTRAYVRWAEARWPPLGRFLDVEGVRLHVLEAGREGAPLLLLIHGASANLRELWSPLGEPLAAEMRVLALDRPGYGYSSRTRGAERLQLQARLAARVLEAAGGSPAIVVGHSLGAASALRLALDHPKLVRGLVLIAPASHPYPGNNAWWARLAAAPLIGSIFSTTIVPLVGPALAKGGVSNNFHPAPVPQGYYEDAGVGLIFRPRAFRASASDVVATKREFALQAPNYPDILTPAIIITADEDKVVSPKRHARGLARDLPAAELIIAPGAGHMPHRLRPDLVLAAIRRLQAMEEASAEG